MNNHQDVDQTTGEVLPTGKKSLWYQSQAARVYKMGDLTPDRPQFMNLKDHKELDGKEIEIRALEFAEGEFGPYVKIGCYVHGADKIYPAVIMTSSEDVYARCLAVQDVVSSDQSVIGTLHCVGKAERAWILS